MSDSNFLVLAADGNLYAYNNRIILAIDLAQHRTAGEPARCVYQRKPEGFAIAFAPMTDAEIVALAFTPTRGCACEPDKADIACEVHGWLVERLEVAK
jgi:hypothetical protein